MGPTNATALLASVRRGSVVTTVTCRRRRTLRSVRGVLKWSGRGYYRQQREPEDAFSDPASRKPTDAVEATSAKDYRVTHPVHRFLDDPTCNLVLRQRARAALSPDTGKTQDEHCLVHESPCFSWSLQRRDPRPLG